MTNKTLSKAALKRVPLIKIFSLDCRPRIETKIKYINDTYKHRQFEEKHEENG